MTFVSQQSRKRSTTTARKPKPRSINRPISLKKTPCVDTKYHHPTDPFGRGSAHRISLWKQTRGGKCTIVLTYWWRSGATFVQTASALEMEESQENTEGKLAWFCLQRLYRFLHVNFSQIHFSPIEQPAAPAGLYSTSGWHVLIQQHFAAVRVSCPPHQQDHAHIYESIDHKHRSDGKRRHDE